MICPNCKSETHRTSMYFLKDRTKIEQCSQCPERYIPRPLFDSSKIKVRGQFGPKSIRTAAHDANIRRRKLAPDGSVYLDYGRRVFA